MVVVKRELVTRYESFITGRSITDIIAEQDASSGMWAFSEGMQTMYLVVLLYLIWPILFNLVGRLFVSRSLRNSTIRGHRPFRYRTAALSAMARSCKVFARTKRAPDCPAPRILWNEE
jgi:hypothetical protein